MATARRLLIAAGIGAGFAPPAIPVDRQILYNGTGDDGVTYAIGAATRTGLDTYAEDVGNPILEKTGSGWEEAGVKDPRLVYTDPGYRFFWSGYDDSLVFNIGTGIGSSFDGPITRYGSNPILDGVAAVPLYVPGLLQGHPWWMWRTVSGDVHAAWSDNGEHWTDVGEVIAGVVAGPVVYRNGTLYLFTNTSDRFTLYTATDPEGPWAESPNGPFLGPRQTNTSPELQANATAGATTLTVTSGEADGFEVGEPVLILDGNTGPEQNAIASVSGATVTLAAPIANSYATADGALVRTMLYNQIDMRSVVRVPGGWEGFGTAFKALDGLTFSGPSVWEGTIRYTATDLDGPWAFDWDTGLVFPLPGGVSWKATSAENPSVIPAP